MHYKTNSRTLSKTELKKEMRKLINNSFFGKTMKNIRKRENN